MLVLYFYDFFIEFVLMVRDHSFSDLDCNCFCMLCAIQLWRRQLVITDREVKFKRVLSLNDKIIARSDIKEVVATKYQLKITDQYRTYSVLMLPKSKEKCLKMLK